MAACIGRSGWRDWRAFFAGGDDEEGRRRAKAWFGGFRRDGRHERGARALCRFALARRDAAWRWVVWGGKHAQAPAVVAQKPHYFCEVDVGETVRNFARELPQFWASDELWETLETGEVVSIDREFFASLLYRRLRDEVQRGGGGGDGSAPGHDASGERGGRSGEGRGAVSRLTTRYVKEEDFSLLCRRVLPRVAEDDVCGFTRGLLPRGVEVFHTAAESRAAREGSPARPGGEPSDAKTAAAAAAFAGVTWRDADVASMAAALATRGRAVVRLVEEGEANETREIVRDALGLADERNGDGDGGRAVSSEASAEEQHLALLRWAAEGERAGEPEAGRFALLLQSWATRYALHVRGGGTRATEAVLRENGVRFTRGDRPRTGGVPGGADERDVGAVGSDDDDDDDDSGGDDFTLVDSPGRKKRRRVKREKKASRRNKKKRKEKGRERKRKRDKASRNTSSSREDEGGRRRRRRVAPWDASEPEGMDAVGDADFGTRVGHSSDRRSSATWRVETDGYAMAWGEADLKDHLADHALARWLAWVAAAAERA